MNAPQHYDWKPPLGDGVSSMGRVLLVEDDAVCAAIFSRLLSHAGFEVAQAGSAAEGFAQIRARAVDVVCLDLGLPDADGLAALQRFQATDSTLPVVILTGDDAVSTVVAAMQEGAYDYLLKSVDATKLVTTIKNAVEKRRLESRLHALEKNAGAGRFGLIGATPAMRTLFLQIERVASSDVTVTILGESGAGKELVARALHDESQRHRGPFVALNCAAIPETLQEAELFGHEKGAFTGAQTRRIGRLEQAHQGTLFLDEIAELSLSLQAKLLRALQERRFTRVGGTQEVESDFRVVTASHKDLAAEVSAGRFREDLYYRLVVFELRVPPLRERQEDIPLLAAHFLARFPGADGKPLRLAPDALETFLVSPWRGNVRELQNAIQHAAVVAQDGVVRRTDLPPRLQAQPANLDALPRFSTPGAMPGLATLGVVTPPAPPSADRPSTVPPTGKGPPTVQPPPWPAPPSTPAPLGSSTSTWPGVALPATPPEWTPAPLTATAWPPLPPLPPLLEDDFTFDDETAPGAIDDEVAEAVAGAVSAATARAAATAPTSPTPPVPSRADDPMQLPALSINEMERLAIVQAIERHNGNLSAAIRELGLGRTTLYRKLKQYDIQVSR